MKTQYKREETIIFDSYNKQPISLRLPIYLDAEKLTSNQIDTVVKFFESTLNGKFFRTRDLFDEVLADNLNDTKKTFSWDRAYIGITPLEHKNEKKIYSCKKLEGGTVLAYDQVLDWMRALS
jgi:hypothetical protein